MQTKYYGAKMSGKKLQIVIQITDSCTSITDIGKSAQENLQLKLIGIAKERMFDTSKTVSEIAYELGFKYAQHFSRMFKNETGYTPVEYRSLN